MMLSSSRDHIGRDSTVPLILVYSAPWLAVLGYPKTESFADRLAMTTLKMLWRTSSISGPHTGGLTALVIPIVPMRT